MEQEFIANWKIQMKKGLLIFLVLNIIKKKNSYGYEIIQKIEHETGLSVAEGSLYPLLKKLKKDQHVLSKWEVNEENAPRKYYYLTGKGNILLKEMNNKWLNLNKSVTSMICN